MKPSELMEKESESINVNDCEDDDEVIKLLDTHSEKIKKELDKRFIDKKEVLKVLIHAYKILKNNMVHLKGKDVERDCKQRIDEIGLIYSDIFNMSFNKAMEEIQERYLIEGEGD